MASTYTPLANYVVTGTPNSSIVVNSISGSYTDLVMIASLKNATSAADPYINFNGDSSNIYSNTTLGGNGSSAYSNRNSNATAFYVENNASVNTSAFGVYEFYFMNYANTNVYKTSLVRANSPAGSYAGTEATVGLYRSTSAITSINLQINPAYPFAVGSTITLYGIKAA
jgi:hypothetical protein